MAKTKQKTKAGLMAEVRRLRRVIRRQHDCIDYIIQAASHSQSRLSNKLEALCRQDPDYLNLAKGC